MATPVDETGAGPLVVGLLEEEATLVGLLEEATLVGLLEEEATLVVTAVTLVVLVEVVDAGRADELVVNVGAEVMDKDDAVNEAENAEQRARPMEAADRRSVGLHDAGRQVSATAWIAACPVPHWQASSEGAQPAAAIPDWRQAICSTLC